MVIEPRFHFNELFALAELLMFDQNQSADKPPLIRSAAAQALQTRRHQATSMLEGRSRTLTAPGGIRADGLFTTENFIFLFEGELFLGPAFRAMRPPRRRL